MKIMQLGKATVHDVDVYARRCQRGTCPNVAVFLVDYPDAQKANQLIEACTDHLSDACRVVNE